MHHKLHLALAGNPNSGKTTLYNQLTGANQKVGNWAGVTVESSWGYSNIGNTEYKVTDLPGAYDLNPDSDDQKVAKKFISTGDYDLIINVIDASCLSRSLYHSLSILTKTNRVVIFLNMMDVARKDGILIDHELLSLELGIPVVPLISIDKTSVIKSMKRLAEILINHNFDTSNLIDKIETSRSIYEKIDRICENCVTFHSEKDNITNKIDKVVLNKYLSVPILLFMMYTVFWVAIGGGSIFIDFFDTISGFIFIDLVESFLTILNAPRWLHLLIPQGIGTGVQTVATFIPVVFFLFLAIGMLEDLGYLARTSVIADRMMKKIGLPGNAFLPMIIGLGCTVPAVMACRTLKTKRDRYMTIFLTPFMSCGARIPVYALFCTALFPNATGLVVFSLYLSGVLLAILTGFLLKKTLFPGETSSLIIELPQYHVPRPIPIIRNALNRMGWFVKRAGKVLVIAVFILSILNNIKLSQSDDSLLTQIGKSMTPIFEPMGIVEDNWQATVALFSGLFAKEAIVGTINSLYSQSTYLVEVEERPSLKNTLIVAFTSLGDGFISFFKSGDLLGIGLVSESSETISNELETDSMIFEQLQNNFTPWAGYAYLLFVLLYFPCLAVVGVAKQEMGMMYAITMVIYSTVLAWCVSTIFYQIAEAHNIWLICLSVMIFGLLVISLNILGKRGVK